MAFKNTFLNLYSVLITTTSALVVWGGGRTGFRRLFLAIACRFHRVINPRLLDKTNAIARACRDLRVCDRPVCTATPGHLRPPPIVLFSGWSCRRVLPLTQTRSAARRRWKTGRQASTTSVEQVHIIRSSIPSGTLTGPDARRTCKRTRSHRCTCRPNLTAAAAQAQAQDGRTRRRRRCSTPSVKMYL